MKYLTRIASTFDRSASSSERGTSPDPGASKRYSYLEDAAMSRAMRRL